MRWRKGAGAVLMMLGACAILAMALLAAIVTGNYLEWDNAADGLSAIAMVTAPPAAAGGALILAGRWLYGGWRNAAPIRNTSSWVLGIGGLLFACLLGVLLFLQAAAGGLAADPGAALFLTAGTSTGAALVVLAARWRLRRKQIR